jgi:hypothetical protein
MDIAKNDIIIRPFTADRFIFIVEFLNLCIRAYSRVLLPSEGVMSHSATCIILLPVAYAALDTAVIIASLHVRLFAFGT